MHFARKTPLIANLLIIALGAAACASHPATIQQSGALERDRAAINSAQEELAQAQARGDTQAIAAASKKVSAAQDQLDADTGEYQPFGER